MESPSPTTMTATFIACRNDGFTAEKYTAALGMCHLRIFCLFCRSLHPASGDVVVGVICDHVSELLNRIFDSVTFG
jgi:hypothetical protein